MFHHFVGIHKIIFNLNDFASYYSILPNLSFIFVVFVLFFYILLFQLLYKAYGYIYLSSLIFTITYALFSIWWEPEYREFWVCPMFSFWIMAILLLNLIINKFNNLRPIIYCIFYSFLSLFVIMLFYFNFTGIIYPYSKEDFKKFDIVRPEVIEKKTIIR